MFVRIHRAAIFLTFFLLFGLAASASPRLQWRNPAPQSSKSDPTASISGKDRWNRHLLRKKKKKNRHQSAVAGGTTPSRNPFRRATYFWVKASPIIIHYRWTQLWLNTISQAPREKRDVVYNELHDRYCQPSLEIILHLQGLFTKIGQVLSARPDFCPLQYVSLLSQVQDSIPPWPFAHVKELAEESLLQHQGLSFDEVFSSMDPIALGTASIGQCHKAVLKKNQRTVAVKIMHPSSKDLFRHDFSIFRWLCRVALPGWRPMLLQLEKQMMTEFDYRQEAGNLRQVRTNMMESPYSNRVVVPEPLEEYCSTNMLVMEMLNGKRLVDAIQDRIGDAIGSRSEAKAFLDRKQQNLVAGVDQENVSAENDLLTLAKETLKRKHPRSSFLQQWIMMVRLHSLHNYCHSCVDLLVKVHGYQIFLNGCHNADCHPGNILQLPNGKLGLIDYGQTNRLSEVDALALSKVVSELGSDTIDEENVADAMRNFGFRTKFDKPHVLTQYAKLFFDSDDEAKALGCVTPQLYLLHLSKQDPLITVPDASIFPARTSYMFRGMGVVMGEQIRTSRRWKKHADEALAKSNSKKR